MSFGGDTDVVEVGSGPSLCGGETDLLVALAGWPEPRRILAVAHERALRTNLQARFPGAAVRHQRPGPHLSVGCADLLWLQFALSARCVDAERVLTAAWRALPDGALIAVVDLARVPDPSTKVWLREGAGLDPDRDTRTWVRRTFATLSCVEVDHPLGWCRTYAFLGVKGSDREW